MAERNTTAHKVTGGDVVAILLYIAGRNCAQFSSGDSGLSREYLRTTGQMQLSNRGCLNFAIVPIANLMI
ncbi:unnamed protein product [Tuber melanosporum]|uniref:(Perigord truffle) hypothetical protein n=1 Tax=Tuber melanosporum (strain Mel28) TaxID=656061 RepID=D5GJF9_TUBMM|nr:uncharacterized protein GSTUM_00008980001 [Tuber melanosporum]CAZ84652.1 unnamed protein product [Tuber melanosporum]